MSAASECHDHVRRPASSFCLREYLYWALPIALLPLAISLGRPFDDTPARFRRTVAAVPIDVRRQVERTEQNPDATFEDLLALLPGRRIQGAFLSRDSGGHWLFAALAATAFVAGIGTLFPHGRTSAASLVCVALFTATAGVMVLLTVQGLVAPSCREILDGDSDFLLSLCGYVLGVGLLEEAVKSLPLLWRVHGAGMLSWRTACLWGFASGTGFGVAEAVHHAERAYNGLATADEYLVRFFSCVALHAVWSATVGLGIVAAGPRLTDMREPAEYVSSMLRVLLGPAVLHGLYDVFLQYEFHAAALAVAIASFGWLAWQIESKRIVTSSPAAPLELSST